MQRHNFWTFLKGLFFMQLFAGIIIFGLSFDFTENVVQRASASNLGSLLGQIGRMHISSETAAAMMRQNNALLAGAVQLPDLNAYIAHQMPKDLLRVNIQALATSEPEEAEEANEGGPAGGVPFVNSLEDQTTNADSGYYKIFRGYKVALYCTHSGESYVPDSGAARTEGGPGLINNVAVRLGQSLKTKGLDAKFVSTLHDYPDFQKSYTNSRKTVARLMADDGSKLLALFDIHRDSIPGNTQGAKVVVNGRAAAPILIIVGTDERKAHPHWRENLTFAQQLYREGAKMYPGLIKEVRTKAGTYNQEFFSKSLLLEFGTDYNTLDECQYSSELFADVLLKVLKEEM